MQREIRGAELALPGVGEGVGGGGAGGVREGFLKKLTPEMVMNTPIKKSWKVMIGRRKSRSSSRGVKYDPVPREVSTIKYLVKG